MRSTPEWRQSGRTTEEGRFEGRRNIIVRAARQCYEYKGVAKTSIADITRAVSITRELFYYYFSNKDLVTASVMTTYMLDARKALSQEVGSLPAEEELESALHAMLRALRSWLATSSESPHPMVDVLRETGYSSVVVSYVAQEAVLALQEIGVLPGKAAPEASESLSKGYQLLIGGVIGELAGEKPCEDAEIVAALVALLR